MGANRALKGASEERPLGRQNRVESGAKRARRRGAKRAPGGRHQKCVQGGAKRPLGVSPKGCLRFAERVFKGAERVLIRAPKECSLCSRGSQKSSRGLKKGAQWGIK